ncbi:hypothetical protein ELAC_2028 [Estrella lausannensis]|uniref:Uncharacterized protein n=1 Tax=Estrella lausannensis TaxID=483423 RepID=A0A0H5E7P2_9BACT|nr:hypothetical protein ELAC_2028 [Estrella lausannensis]
MLFPEQGKEQIVMVLRMQEELSINIVSVLMAFSQKITVKNPSKICRVTIIQTIS